MNQRQKLVQQKFLNDEEKIIKRLHLTYSQSLAQVNEKIKNLQFNIDNLQEEYDWMDDTDPKKAQVKSKIQSKIYQKQYQEQLQKQLDGILDKMNTQQYLSVSDYLEGCYEDGFVGSMFDMHGQGVPLMIPLDQEAMVRAVQLESKISEGLYTRLGADVDQLKIQIRGQVSRSIATGMSYAQAAKRLENYTRIGYNKAIRIARTEGHRVQTTAAMDACHKAKERGADVLKQWDATLDDATRESHRQVDGEIRELDASFSNGLDFPGDPAGGAGEVVNCRCALLQRARWALDEDELHTLEERAAYYGLDKSETFEDFKAKYLKAVNPAGTVTPPVKIGGVDCVVTKGTYGFGDGTATGVKKTVESITYTTPDGVNFIFPKKYNKKQQHMTPEQAISCWEKVPQGIKRQAQKTVEFVDYYNPQDSYWKKVYKNFPHSYATGGDKITFYRYDYDHDLDYVVRTYCHEAGHYIDTSLGTGGTLFSSGKDWTTAMNDDILVSQKRSPTTYGENAPTEDFAESIAEYVKDPVDFVAKFPNRAAILAKII